MIDRIFNLDESFRDEWVKEHKGEADESTLSADEKLLQKAETFILENISSPDLKVGIFASELAMSERQLGRIVKKLSGLTPNQFIREIRLRRAHQLLEQRAYPAIADVAYQVGIDNPSYFSKLYLQRFGKQPSEV